MFRQRDVHVYIVDRRATSALPKSAARRIVTELQDYEYENNSTVKDNWSRPSIRAVVPCEFDVTLSIAISVSMTSVDISIHHDEYSTMQDLIGLCRVWCLTKPFCILREQRMFSAQVGLGIVGELGLSSVVAGGHFRCRPQAWIL